MAERRPFPPPVLVPLRNREFRRYFAGQTVSFLGDGVVPVTFALAVLQLSSGGWGMPLVLLALWLSRTACIAVGGTYADRYNRASVMIVADVVRLLAQVAVALVFTFGAPSLWELVVSAAVYGAATAFFAPSSVGLVPRLLPRDQLQRANSLLGTVRNAALLAGPAGAALMVSAGGVELALWFDAATFAVSVLCLAGVRAAAGEPVHVADDPTAQPEPEGESGEQVRFRDGLAAMLRMRPVVWIVAVWCFAQIGVASLNVLGPIISSEQLGGADRWAVLVTSMAVGGLAGSALVGSVPARRPVPLILLLLAVPMPLQLVALAVPLNLPVLAVSFVVTSAALAACGVLFDTYLQNTVPDHLLARISSAESGLTTSMIPLGFAICLPLAHLAGFPLYLGTLAALLVATAVLGSALIHGGSAPIAPTPVSPQDRSEQTPEEAVTA